MAVDDEPAKELLPRVPLAAVSEAREASEGGKGQGQGATAPAQQAGGPAETTEAPPLPHLELRTAADGCVLPVAIVPTTSQVQHWKSAMSNKRRRDRRRQAREQMQIDNNTAQAAAVAVPDSLRHILTYAGMPTNEAAMTDGYGQYHDGRPPHKRPRSGTPPCEQNPVEHLLNVFSTLAASEGMMMQRPSDDTDADASGGSDEDSEPETPDHGALPPTDVALLLGLHSNRGKLPAAVRRVSRSCRTPPMLRSACPLIVAADGAARLRSVCGWLLSCRARWCLSTTLA
jgi:hypothetical protein